MDCKCRACLLMVLRVGLVGHIPEFAESIDRRANVVWDVRCMRDCGHTSLPFRFEVFGIRKRVRASRESGEATAAATERLTKNSGKV